MKQLLPKLLNRSYSLLFILSFLLSSLGWGQYNTSLIYPAGTTSFTVPCGVTEIYVQVYGAGGGGGRGNANGGSGGGGGGYTYSTITVVPGASYSIVVGSGGSGGAGGAGNGTAGGPSSFGGALLVANGGGGGGVNGGSVGSGGTATGGTPTPGNQGIIGTSIVGGGGGDNGQGNGGSSDQSALDTDGLIGGTGGGGSGGGPDGPDGGGAGGSGGAGGDGRVIISYNGPNAGPNQNLVCASSSTTLAANSPAGTASGTWSVISGSATVTSPNSPTSTVTGIASGACATLRWTWTGGGAGCTTVFNDMIICRDGTGACNDNPCSAINLGTPSATSCSPTTYSNVGSTASYNVLEPGCASYSDNDVWFQMTVPASGELNLNTADSPGGALIYPHMALYTGSTCTNLTHQGCYNGTSTNSVVYTGTPGETIYVRVWDDLEAEGQFTLCAFTTANAGEGSIMPGLNTFTCGSSGTGIFVDPGGSSNYLDGQANSYTICPSNPNEYVSVSFTQFSLGSGDQMIVINGGSPGDPIKGVYTGTQLNGQTITSSDLGGCLTFSFSSNDGGTPGAGWLANVSCSSTAGTNNNGTYTIPGNCNGGGGVWACQDGGYPTQNAGTSGVEELSELTTGCFGAAGETSSTWFYFQPSTSGTLGMTFDGPPGQDYDYAIYGPSTDYSLPCPAGTGDGPIRCSYSAAANPVGLGNGAEDFIEGAEGNGWVAPLNVQVGETYVMVFNIFQMGNPQPDINITFSGTAILDCTPFIPLPSLLTAFNGYHSDDRYNYLEWITSSEINSDYFLVERSLNGQSWTEVGTLMAAGSSQSPLHYSIQDYNYFMPITYYRLKMVDFDGQYSYSNIISINASYNVLGNDIISNLFPNPTSDYFTFAYNGSGTKMNPLIIEVFNSIGQVVYVEEYDDLSKNDGVSINTSNFSPGIYTIFARQGDYSLTRKISILK